MNGNEHFLIFAFASLFLQKPLTVLAWDTGTTDASSSELDDNTRQRVLFAENDTIDSAGLCLRSHRVSGSSYPAQLRIWYETRRL